MLTASLKHLGNYMLIAIVRQDARTKVRAYNTKVTHIAEGELDERARECEDVRHGAADDVSELE